MRGALDAAGVGVDRLEIIRMASSLGMRTVAEGVETPEQLAFLRERGCHAMQGWLLARPLDAEGFARFVRERL